MNRKHRNVLLVAILVLAALVLSGCGVPKEPIDLNAPPGWFEAIFVYPLTRLLIILSKFIDGAGIPYSYGWAIILLTVLVKVVTFPLTLKQLQSSKAMMALQPRMRELQEKYGKDKQKLAEEQTKLYQEAGVSPVGGCLPMLIQMPVLIALYQSLYVLASPSVGELTGAGFFWIPDLAFPDPTTGMRWITTSFNAGDWGKLIAYLILPVITLITSFMQQKMTQQPKDPKAKPDPQSQMMNQMMVMMPLMFVLFSLQVSAGLVLYWVVSTILAIIQQYFVTGWGGLTEWLPFLKKKEAFAYASAAPTAPVQPPAPAPAPAPEKPIKRRRRRR